MSPSLTYLPWHPFQEDESYDLAEVVKVIQNHIADRGFRSEEWARRRLEDIANGGHRKLLWKPFGRPKSFTPSPLNWRAWQTEGRRPIYPDDHIVP